MTRPRRIRALDARCRLVFERAADAMAIVAPGGDLIDANRWWTELFGAIIDDDSAVAGLVRGGDARDTVARRARVLVGRDVTATVEAAAKLAATEAVRDLLDLPSASLRDAARTGEAEACGRPIASPVNPAVKS